MGGAQAIFHRERNAFFLGEGVPKISVWTLSRGPCDMFRARYTPFNWAGKPQFLHTARRDR
ncbi:hypothetical protein CIC12_03535 [Burkholderia sp. SG-MS1]|nr:hypothetical protein [Paraburkholderia sp. SG-MS1]